MKLFDNMVMGQFLRFYELYDLYLKKDGRLSISFEDNGYVDDIDNFITGCISGIRLFFTCDYRSVDKVLLSNTKQFKTLIDFVENKITCQGLYFKDIEGYLRRRIMDLNITIDFMVHGDNNDDIIKFLKHK